MTAVGAAERIFQVLDRIPRINFEGGIELKKVEGNLNFEGVSFSYPNKKEISTLRELSFQLCPGKVVALLG